MLKCRLSLSDIAFNNESLAQVNNMQKVYGIRKLMSKTFICYILRDGSSSSCISMTQSASYKAYDTVDGSTLLIKREYKHISYVCLRVQKLEFASPIMNQMILRPFVSCR